MAQQQPTSGRVRPERSHDRSSPRVPECPDCDDTGCRAMKSTTSSSSASSREERSLPKLLVSDSDGVNVLPNCDNSSNKKSNEVISRKNSKSSLKSNSSLTDVSNRDEILASMIKNRMRELEDGEPSADPQHPNLMTDQTTAPLLKPDAPVPVTNEERPAAGTRKYSRSHQRRFHRRFPAIPATERLIDWYNCALISDILLQGHLYVSDNHVAFYSNIFGYKTQFLIPISDVVAVTKEKTAKIFPNAVGICTDEAKYVFGSLLSREAAFRLLQVRVILVLLVSHCSFLCRTFGAPLSIRYLSRTPVAAISDSGSFLSQVASDSCHSRLKKMRDSSATETSGSTRTDEISTGIAEKRLSVSDDDEDEEEDESDSASEESSMHPIEPPVRPISAIAVHHSERTSFGQVLDKISNGLNSIKRPKNNLFAAATVALVLLFLSATFLLLRANFLYSRLTELTGDTHLLTTG